jgi:uncharacterized protein involved in exopolysaccharide biosynthesis
MTYSASPATANTGVDLREVFSVLWASKLVISGFVTFCAICAVLVSLMLPNVYVSTATLAPTESSSGGMSSLMQQYGALARMAGVSLPGSADDSKSALALELMKSRLFVGDFIEQRRVLPELFAADSWNEFTGELSYSDDIYDVSSKQWVRDVDPPMEPRPSRQEAYDVFTELLSVTENPKNGFVYISIEHRSPVLAQQWLAWFIEDVNRIIKQRDVEEARRSIDYLRKQIDATELSELKVMFFELIQSQAETIMLAEARPEYVYQVIDPPVVPEQAAGPKRALICIMVTFISAFIACALVLSKYYLFAAIRH